MGQDAFDVAGIASMVPRDNVGLAGTLPLRIVVDEDGLALNWYGTKKGISWA